LRPVRAGSPATPKAHARPSYVDVTTTSLQRLWCISRDRNVTRSPAAGTRASQASLAAALLPRLGAGGPPGTQEGTRGATDPVPAVRLPRSSRNMGQSRCNHLAVTSTWFTRAIRTAPARLYHAHHAHHARHGHRPLPHPALTPEEPRPRHIAPVPQVGRVTARDRLPRGTRPGPESRARLWAADRRRHRREPSKQSPLAPKDRQLLSVTEIGRDYRY